MIDEMVFGGVVLAGECAEDVLPPEPVLGLGKRETEETDVASEAHDGLHELVHAIVDEGVIAHVTEPVDSDLLGTPVLLHGLGIDDELVISHLAGAFTFVLLAGHRRSHFLQLQVGPELVEGHRPAGCHLT